MTPSTDVVDVPTDAVAVARRYRRLERPTSVAAALLVGTAAAAALLSFPLVQGALLAGTVVLAVRVPVFRSGGTARLVTDADPGTVRTDFAGPTPPPLAFQWGIADGVRRTDDGAAYELSYLFGTRSVTMETEVRSEPVDGSGPADEITLVVTAAGRPWATYVASVREGGSGTTVDVEWTSDRRFGLRRLPQTFVANRYRTEALEAQGYEVVERDARLTL